MMFMHETVEFAEVETVEIDGQRFYQVEGNHMPSITTVLSILSEKSIAKWKARVGEEKANYISRTAATHGTVVHQMMEDYINNLKPKYDNNLQQAAFLKLRKVCDERIGKVYAQEVPLYSVGLRIAGRVDCVAEFDGKISIIDFKTSAKPKRREYIYNYFMQETAYAKMWEERTGTAIEQIVTIVAPENSPMAQVFVESTEDWIDQLKETIDRWWSEKSVINE